MHFSILPKNVQSQIFLYLTPNKIHTRFIDIYSASCVCKAWNELIKPIIKEAGEQWLKNIISKKIEGNGGRLVKYEFRSIAALASEQFVSSKLISSFINQEADIPFIIKVVSVAKTVKIQHFNEALATKNLSSDVLLTLLDKLKEQQEECAASVIEQNNLEGLKILFSSPKFKVSEKYMLHQSFVNKKQSISEFLISKYPLFKEDAEYFECILKEEINNLRELASTESQIAQKFQEIFDNPDFIKDPNNFISAFLESKENVTNSNLESYLIGFFEEGAKCQLAYKDFTKFGIKHCHNGVEYLNRKASRIEEIYADKEFQINPKKYLSNLSLNCYVKQPTDRIEYEVLNFLRELYSVKDIYGEGALMFSKVL